MTRFLGCVRPGDLFIELNHSWRNSALYGIDTNLLGKLSFVEIVITSFVAKWIVYFFLSFRGVIILRKFGILFFPWFRVYFQWMWFYKVFFLDFEFQLAGLFVRKLIKFSVSSRFEVWNLSFFLLKCNCKCFPSFFSGDDVFSEGIFDEISNFKIAVTPRFKVSRK